MRRKTSHDHRYKKSVWTQNQKLEAVSTYLMLGSMPQTAIVTGIPLPTLKSWKGADWFNLQRIVNKALKATEDRIDFGDSQYDQRTGDIVRVPIKAHVALKISTELLTKQQKLTENPIKEEVEKTIDDRLLRLSEEFAKFASKKLGSAVPIDVEAKVVQA
jgi:hypothetical protein